MIVSIFNLDRSVNHCPLVSKQNASTVLIDTVRVIQNDPECNGMLLCLFFE